MSIDPESKALPDKVARAGWFALTKLLAVALGLSCLWAYWPTLRNMADRWSHEPQYSHGYLVPVFALYLLWHRRHQVAAASFRGSPWGLLVVVAAVGLRLAATYLYIPWLEALSFLPCLFGVTLLLGGWSAIRWAWPALAFLVFMLPLPFQVERGLAYPLQRMATLSSTGCLETLGFRATSEGNIIWVWDETRINVAEACGGLSMLLTFIALAVAFAVVVPRPVLDKVLFILSAIPIALGANVVRITITGILHEVAGAGVARAFHASWAGWFMILLAVGLLWLEAQILSWLLVERGPIGPVPLGTLLNRRPALHP